MKKRFRLTSSGVTELKNELETLIAKRSTLADAIRSARELGDLAENAEYQSARADQERNEIRVVEVENILANAEVIKKPSAGGKVQLGSVVKLSGEGKTKEFQVVGTVEADPLNGKISDESPIGVALLGKKEGDAVEIVIANDASNYKIVSIS